MIIRALIEGRHYSFDTEDLSQTIGRGGEAVVMRWDPPKDFTSKFGNGNYAVKLFFMDKPEQRANALVRQQKLRNVPKGLPRNAITPTTLVTDATGSIIGYVMPLIEGVKPLSLLMDPDFVKDNRISLRQIIQILLGIGGLMNEVHKAGVVIGDFNDKNVLVNILTGEAYLIDVDSTQWGTWLCLTATNEFTDPLLLDESFMMKSGARYSNQSDVYAFTVIVYQLLTRSHPYRDGSHRPRQKKGQAIVPSQRFPQRVTSRLSVFDSSIRLPPDDVHHPASLPAALGLFMRDTFVNDARVEQFPFQLLTSFTWMTCPKCGREHGRSNCPTCNAPGVISAQTRQAPPAATPPPTATAPSGPPTATRPAVSRESLYLAVASNGGRLQYVCHSGGAYRNEQGLEILRAPQHHPDVSVLVAGDRTVFASRNEFAIVNGDPRRAKRYISQRVHQTPAIAANSRHVYWVSQNSLVRDDAQRGTITIGSVAKNMTSVWVGERFGVALVQAGVVNHALVFDAERAGVAGFYLPLQRGTVIDAHCVVSDTHAWLFVAYRMKNGQVVNACYVLDAQARLQATAVAPSGNSWLGTVPRTALAVSNKLFVPQTRTGIVRIGITGTALAQEAVHRGAAGVISSDRATVGLALTQRGLVHIGTRQITPIA